MLEVTVLSTDRDLATTSALKAVVMGATATSTGQDAYLSTLVRRGSRAVETFIGYPLTVQSYRETLSGNGRRRLMLSRTPVRAIRAIYDSTSTEDATVLGTSEYILENREAGFIARDRGFAWTATLQHRGAALSLGDAIPLEPGPVPGEEYRPWMVDYVAGFTYDGIDTGSSNWSTVGGGTTSTGRTLPEDIEAAVLMKANLLFENNDGVEAEKLGDLEVRYKQNLKSAESSLEPWQESLEAYRRVW